MKKRILIAEDEKPIARALELKLSGSGYEAVAAYNGEEAIEKMEEGEFDLVLLDLVMPKMDGFAVLGQMQANNKKIPVIVLSNLGQEEDIKRAKTLGAIDYFVKSNISLTEVVSYIDNLFASKGE